MTVIAVGTRVFAVQSAGEDEVRSYGPGVYAGDFPRPGTTEPDEAEIAEVIEIIEENERERPIEDALEHYRQHYASHVESGEVTQAEADEYIEKHRQSMLEYRARPARERALEIMESMANNPRIDLDQGGSVWGFQCWWGPEAQFDDWVAGREIVIVSPDDPVDLASLVD